MIVTATSLVFSRPQACTAGLLEAELGMILQYAMLALVKPCLDLGSGVVFATVKAIKLIVASQASPWHGMNAARMPSSLLGEVLYRIVY